MRFLSVKPAHSFYFHFMKSFSFIVLIVALLVLHSCGSPYPKAENAFDAGREFIDASLKGDWDKAQFYMLRNEANDKELNKLKEEYRDKSNDQKQQYHNASIIVLEENTVSDSVHIINYKNSFDSIARKLKVMQTKDGWLVDLFYTFSGNM